MNVKLIPATKAELDAAQAKALENNRMVYRVTRGLVGYLPYSIEDFDTLDAVRDYVREVKAEYEEENSYGLSAWRFDAWESISRLRKYHLLHAGDAGITLGIFEDDSSFRSNEYIDVAYVPENL